LTRIDHLKDAYSLAIRCLQGHLGSYKFLYDQSKSVSRSIGCWILTNLHGRADIHPHFRGSNYKAIWLSTTIRCSGDLYPTHTVISLVLPQDFVHHVSLASLPGLDCYRNFFLCFILLSPMHSYNLD
ncbi:hypothetical protein P692DRAFT_20711424, partial [Suillus brevipes Sb2]